MSVNAGDGATKADRDEDTERCHERVNGYGLELLGFCFLRSAVEEAPPNFVPYPSKFGSDNVKSLTTGRNPS
jgi:hypothetical protein